MSKQGYRFGAREAFVLVAALLSALVAIGYQTRDAWGDAATNGSFQFANTSNVPTAGFTVTEGQQACIPVHRSQGTAGDQQVQITATPNAPATATDVGGFTNMYLTFQAGVIDRTVDTLTAGSCLVTNDDSIVQGTRTVTFQIALIFGGGVASGQTTFTLTILDNDGPQVTGLSPFAGPMAGGTVVTITGSGFTGTSAGAGCPGVELTATTGVHPTTCTVYSNTQITATFPAHAAGTVHVRVTNNSLTSADTAADDFTYTDGPIITSISPTSGPAAGGTSLQINGLNLSSPTSVTVGGNPCGTPSGNATQITCTTPAKGVGPNVVDVVVTTASGTSPNTAADNFTYTGITTITSVSPPAGPTAGGIFVTFFGTNLTGTTSASLGGSNCVISGVPGASSFSCITTAHTAGLVQAAIVNPAGNATLNNAFTYTDAPTVTNLNPSFCPPEGGNTITITGTGFVGGAGNTIVSFGGIAGTNVNVTSTTGLTVTCPAQLVGGVVDVRVQTAAGTSLNTVADNFTYGTNIPVITSISPAAGPIVGGTPVTIYGANFTGALSVTFGGFACTSVNVVLSTQITCVTPAHLGGTVEVIVTTPIGSNTTIGTQNDFFYTGGPTVTFISPSTGPATGNTIVTITGTGFTSSGMTVKFGTVAAVFTYIDTTTIVAVAPAQSAGTVDVIVTTPGGTSPNTAADNYTYTGTSVPVVTSVTPASGPIGTTITITGTGFTGATSVTVGGVSASFTVVLSTQITATVPAGTPAGVVDVRVTGPGGMSANTAADNFTNTSAGQTVTYTLYFRFTLLVWTGKNNIGALAALSGQETPDNPQTNNVSGSVGAIYRFNGSTQSWEAYFPGSDGVPGANNFTTLQNGTAYFIALKGGGTMSWTVLAGP